MKTVTPLAEAIRRANFSGENPFTYSQARDLEAHILNQEFHPTSKYWSLLNNSNEVLIGTRGCGKSILLRMLCFSHYRQTKRITDYMRENGKHFYGFYIPLRLQLLSELPRLGNHSEAIVTQERRRRFRFIFNCLAAGSYLEEVKVLLSSRIEVPSARLLVTRKIIDHLGKHWNLPPAFDCASVQDLQFVIDELFTRVRIDWRTLDRTNSLLAGGLLEPILAVRSFVDAQLQLEKHSRWLACVDEAEYLQPDLQASINTILRSAIPGLSVKIATLPLHWTELQTEIEGVRVLSGGDDFRFSNLDYRWDSKDFVALTNKIFAGRLRTTRIVPEKTVDNRTAFDEFLGHTNDISLIDLYRCMLGSSFDPDKFAQLVRSEMDHRGRRRAKSEPNRGEVKKYEPIVLLRLLRRMLKGNTRVPRLSGPRTAQRVCGGNARRFIQLCNVYFELARSRDLDAETQHAAVLQFSQAFCDRAEAVDTEGFVLKRFVSRLAEMLRDTTHQGQLTDVGLSFRLSTEVFQHPRLLRAIRAGVAYSYLVRPPEDVAQPLSPDSELSLANPYAAVYWLPMRSGTRARVAAPDLIAPLVDQHRALSEAQAGKAVDALQMNLFDRETKT